MRIVLELPIESVAILDRLAPNSRRKSEVVIALLEVAHQREAKIQEYKAAPDLLTKSLLNLRWEREAAQTVPIAERRATPAYRKNPQGRVDKQLAAIAKAAENQALPSELSELG